MGRESSRVLHPANKPCRTTPKGKREREGRERETIRKVFCEEGYLSMEIETKIRVPDGVEKIAFYQKTINFRDRERKRERIDTL